MIYLIGKEVFDKKIAIIGSFLLAISSFELIFTMAEMDISAAFFVLLGSLFFIKRLKEDGNLSYLAAVLIGIAALIKTLALFFVPAFIIGYMVHNKKIFDKKTIMSVIKFGIIITLIFSPIFIHNWLWYQDKGMVDAYLAQYFDIGEARKVYEQAQGVHPGFKFSEVFSGSVQMGRAYALRDPFGIILGTLGLIYFTLRKSKFSIFFLLFQILPFLLITITNRLDTHYVVLAPVFALYGAALIDKSIKLIKEKISYNKILSAVLILIVIVNFYLAFPYIGHKSAVGQMRDYTIENIDENSIIVADSRIYRGRIMWMFLDRHYIEASLFSEVIGLNQQIPGENVPIKVYFVECIPDDCGWGTVKDQPDFNQSMENIASSFKNVSNLEKTINGRFEGYKNPQRPYFNVYSGVINLNPQILNVIDSTHSFFFYPAMYKPESKIFDTYNVNGPINKALYFMAKMVIWLSILASLLSILLVFYLLYKER